ncbi:MAG: hypothetical protein R2712_04505 [Vicinamibacterales bacterium]
MASAAKETAVSKPKHVVAPTMSLSMVFGTPTSGNALQVELVGDGECAVAADGHQRIHAHLVKGFDDPIGVVHLPVRRVGRVLEGVSVVGRAEDGPAQAQDAGDVVGGQGPRPAAVEQAVEAVFEADDFDLRVAGRLDDGPDDGIEARGIPAAGEDANLTHSHVPAL